MAIGSLLRAAQSSPPTFTRPVPIVVSTSWVTMPWRPMSGPVREGTPGPPMRSKIRDRSTAIDTRQDDDERGELRVDAVSEIGGRRGGDRADADERRPEVGQRHLEDGGDRSQPPATPSAGTSNSIHA